MKKKFYKLIPSKKVEGDLIAYMPTSKGSMIVIIDKNNPNFVDAEAGQVWEVNIRTKEGAKFALGDLVRKLEIETSIDILVDNVKSALGLVVKDCVTKTVLCVIPFRQGLVLEGFTLNMVKNMIKSSNLDEFEGRLLEETEEGLKGFNRQMDQGEEVVKDAMTLLEEAPRPDIFQEDFEVEPLSRRKIEDEVWKLIDPFAIPDASDIADQILLKLSCFLDQKTGEFRRINFV